MHHDKEKINALSKIMDCFGQRHLNQSYSSGRGQLSIKDTQIFCTVGSKTIDGYASAPLMFVTGAWAQICAHEGNQDFAHLVNGHINRVWPYDASLTINKHGIGAEVKSWAALWPGLLFSSSIYEGVDTPGHPQRPRIMDSAPSRTSLTGILKNIVKSFREDDPLERLKAAEFVEYALRREWSYTGEDQMMAVVKKPLISLLDDPESSIRELAILALETCAIRCWREKAYGLYEPICRILIEAGFNADLQYMRLSESFYASGNIEEGDRLWDIGSSGQNPLRIMKLDRIFGDEGDLNDLHTNILKRAGEAHIDRAYGNDPSPARQAKRAKKAAIVPAPEDVSLYYDHARVLLKRAEKAADPRLTLELSKAQESRWAPPLHEIFFLQSHIAQADGTEHEQIKLIFKGQGIAWRLQGASNPHWRLGNEGALLKLVSKYDDDILEQFGIPEYLKPLLADLKKEKFMSTSEEGEEQLFWRRFISSVREKFIYQRDFDNNPLPGAELVSGFTVSRENGKMVISHEVMSKPFYGPLSTPVLNSLRAWNGALLAKYGQGSWYKSEGLDPIITLSDDDIQVVATIAQDVFEKGAVSEALALYRFIVGTDPFVMPWPYRNPVEPFPVDQVAKELVENVAIRSDLEENQGHKKLKPKGRRIEQLARDFEKGDSATRRYIGRCMYDACSASGDEIERVIKSGKPLLLKMLCDDDPQVREAGIIAAFKLFHMCNMYFSDADVRELLELVQDIQIADLTHFNKLI